MSDQKEFFRHSQLIAEVRRHLKTAALRDRFIEGVEGYGLEGIEPAFEDCPELKTAFAKVRPELAKGWAASQAAGYSNAVQASKAKPEKKGKGKAKAPSAQPAPPEAPKRPPLEPVGEMPPIPAHKAPAPEVVEGLRAQGFAAILSAPEPPSGEELRFLFGWLGPEVSSCLLWALEKVAEEYGPQRLWEGYGKNAVEMCVKIYEKKAAAFASHFGEWCPKLNDMERPLTFANYQRLRCRYGRANVCAKIRQLMKQNFFNLGVDCAVVLEKYILRSIDEPKGSKFWMVAFDDEMPDLGFAGGFSSKGFDKNFDLPPAPLVKIDF